MLVYDVLTQNIFKQALKLWNQINVEIENKQKLVLLIFFMVSADALSKRIPIGWKHSSG